jgi:hypothetical protein
MQQPISIFAAVFTIALTHSILPHHWIPFALVGKGQGWSMTKTLGITALSSLGHSLATTAMGLVVAFLGFQLTKYVERTDLLTGGILIGLGTIYIAFTRRHTHNHGPLDPALSDRAAALSLFSTVSLSPCVELLPIFLAASTFTLSLLLLMGVVLAAANILGMLSLTAMAYMGVQRLKLYKLEHQERKIIGLVLILVGVALILYHHT